MIATMRATPAASNKRPAATTDAPQPKKKRARTSASPEAEDKKRGRPKIEKQDESAADRRRTQIRMAQRAYRQRKESTLDELRKRVSELTQTVEKMNRAFSTCADRLYAGSLTQEQMLDLNEVSIVFEKLVGEARHPSEEGEAEPNRQRKPSHAGSAAAALAEVPEQPTNVPAWLDKAVASVVSGSANEPAIVPDQPQNVPSWLDASAVASSRRKATSGEYVGMGYSMVDYDDNAIQMIDAVVSGTASQQLQDMLCFSEPFPKDQSMDLLQSAHETSSIRNSPRPVMTYSFQESTFARRLHRACAESAYYLLMDPRRRPAEYDRIFRLTLLGRDRNKIAEALKSVIERGPHEDLDFWAAPHVHVGGAGTHYPRRDPFGNLMPKKTSYNVGRIGPQTFSMLENAVSSNMDTHMAVEIAGFEGEWFDPYDVQGYLEEKGIIIDPTSSFAEAEIVEWPKGINDASTVTSEGNVPTPPGEFTAPQKSTPLTATQVNALIEEADVDFSKWDDSANLELTNVGYSDAQFGSWANFLQPGEAIRHYNVEHATWEDFNLGGVGGLSVAESMPQSPQPKRKKIVIDVTKLVKVLVLSGVCLGRVPGFRRKDVDRALAISSFDNF